MNTCQHLRLAEDSGKTEHCPLHFLANDMYTEMRWITLAQLVAQLAAHFDQLMAGRVKRSLWNTICAAKWSRTLVSSYCTTRVEPANRAGSIAHPKVQVSFRAGWMSSTSCPGHKKIKLALTTDIPKCQVSTSAVQHQLLLVQHLYHYLQHSSSRKWWSNCPYCAEI